MLPSSYNFSPDHAGVLESFEEHKNANWVQFIVGGSAIEYRSSAQNRYIDVRLIKSAKENGVLRYLSSLNSSNCRATNSSTLTPTN
jgi:hypothetical protein